MPSSSACAPTAAFTPTLHRRRPPHRAADHASTGRSSPARIRQRGLRRRPSTRLRMSNTARCGSGPGPGCIPSSKRTLVAARARRGGSCVAPSSWSRSAACQPDRTNRRCYGSGTPVRTNQTWICCGGPTFDASTWNTPCASASRAWVGRRREYVTPSRPTAGRGWWSPSTPSCDWHDRGSAIAVCRGSVAWIRLR